MDLLHKTEGAPGAERCLERVIQGIDSPADDDDESNNDNLWERVLKVVADRDVGCLGSQREGKEGKDMGAPMKASGEEEVQLAGSSQLTSAPSSNDTISSVGIQVQRTCYFLLLEIDGLLMWQWYGQRGSLRDNIGLTV